MGVMSEATDEATNEATWIELVDPDEVALRRALPPGVHPSVVERLTELRDTTPGPGSRRRATTCSGCCSCR